MYCNECHGYFRVVLNAALNINVRIRCPNCGHLHDRHIKDGVIKDGCNQRDTIVEEIVSPKSSYTKTPIAALSRPYMRDGVPFGDAERDILYERRMELYGDKV